MAKNNYVIITSARNEERNIERIIQSVLSQTALPSKWVLIDDCSSDSTPEIISKYEKRHKLITLIQNINRRSRSFDSKAIAIQEAYKLVTSLPFDYIGNVDADVSFKPAYFERLIRHFSCNPNLGIAGGIIQENINGKFCEQMMSRNSVAGAIQLFRRSCYEVIGGYRPLSFGGIDALAEISARMHGWDVETFYELKVLHHRRVGEAGGNLIKGRFKSGIKDQRLGYHPFFQILRILYRVKDRPYLIGSTLQLAGYFYAVMSGKASEVPFEVRQFVRKEQILRIMAWLKSLLSAG